MVSNNRTAELQKLLKKHKDWKTGEVKQTSGGMVTTVRQAPHEKKADADASLKKLLKDLKANGFKHSEPEKQTGVFDKYAYEFDVSIEKQNSVGGTKMAEEEKTKREQLEEFVDDSDDWTVEDGDSVNGKTTAIVKQKPNATVTGLSAAKFRIELEKAGFKVTNVKQDNGNNSMEVSV